MNRPNTSILFPAQPIIKPLATALTLALTLALAGCGGGGSSSSSSGAAGLVTVTSVKNITLIDYNDLHAHLVQHKDLIKTADGSKVTTIRGGLPQIKTLIDGIRAENCNSILMNIGDTYHGGVEAFYTDGDAIIDPVNALGIDVGVPGNWDYAYGSDKTRTRYEGITPREYKGCTPGDTGTNTDTSKQPNFTNLASNVFNDQEDNGIGEPPGDGVPDSTDSWLPATKIIDVDGVMVGFIGISSDIVPDMQEKLAESFIFLRQQDEYRDLINRHAADLRARGANIVVVMSELGIQKDLKLGDVINPGVDFIFSAHTHELVRVPFTTASGTQVAEAGNDIYFGRLDIRWDDTNKKILDKTWKIVEVTQDTPADPTMQALVDTARAPFLAAAPDYKKYGQTLTQPINTIVGKTDKALDRRNALENSFNRAYTNVLREAAGTQLAVSAGWRYDTALPVEGTILEDNTVADGNITLEDMYRFFPFHVPVSTAKITGQNLKAVEELTLSKTFSTDVFKQSGGWQQGTSGVDFTVDLAKPDGERVTSMRFENAEIQPTDEFTITGCASFLSTEGNICGEAGYTDIAPLPISTAEAEATGLKAGDQWDALNLFIYGLQQGFVDGAQPASITDTNNTEFWPVSDYVQPLYGVGVGVDVP